METGEILRRFGAFGSPRSGSVSPDPIVSVFFPVVKVLSRQDLAGTEINGGPADVGCRWNQPSREGEQLKINL